MYGILITVYVFLLLYLSIYKIKEFSYLCKFTILFLAASPYLYFVLSYNAYLPTIFLAYNETLMLITSALFETIVRWYFIFIFFSLVTFLYLLKREHIKRKVDYSESWKSFRDYLFKDSILSTLLFMMVILIGMIGAGFVNFLTTDIKDNTLLLSFIIGGLTGLILISLGIWVITPLVDFRFRYKFLIDYNKENASFIYTLRNRSANLKNNEKGVISFQLFEISHSTIGNNISYNFKEIWCNKDPESNISKFKPLKVNIPIEFHEFFGQIEENNLLNTNFLNDYTTNIIKSRFSHKIFIPPIYFSALYALLDELFYKEKIKKYKNLGMEEEERVREEIKSDFKAWIKNWKLSPNVESTKYRSVHYSSFFSMNDMLELNLEDDNNIFPSTDTLEKYLLTDFEEIRFQDKKSFNYENLDFTKFVLLRNYKGGTSIKQHRQYYNLHLKTKTKSDYSKTYILLMIADSRLINPKKALGIFKKVLY